LENFFQRYFEGENFHGNNVKYKQEADYEFRNFKEDHYIRIESNSNIGLPAINIEEFQCEFILPFRYRTWCIGESISPYDWRNQWRKYIWLTIKALGGNRAVYLADNGHPLENFRYLRMSLDDVEKALKNEFGSPASSLELAYNNTILGKNLYYIDHFEDFAY